MKRVPLLTVVLGMQPTDLRATGQLALFSAPDCNAINSRYKKFNNTPPIDNVVLPNSFVPHGAATPEKPFSWAMRPRIGMGNKPPGDWTHIVATGMIYSASNNSLSHGAYVEIRGLDLFVMPKALGRWCLLDHSDFPSGRFFREDFAGDISERGEVSLYKRSIRIRTQKYRVFHFWGRRATLPKGGVAGVYVQYEARIIPSYPARYASGRVMYVGAASADYWKSADASPGFVGILNQDVAIGRFKPISTRFQVFSMNSNAW